MDQKRVVFCQALDEFAGIKIARRADRYLFRLGAFADLTIGRPACAGPARAIKFGQILEVAPEWREGLLQIGDVLVEIVEAFFVQGPFQGHGLLRHPDSLSAKPAVKAAIRDQTQRVLSRHGIE